MFALKLLKHFFNDTVFHCEFPNEFKRLMLQQFLTMLISQKLKITDQ